MATTTENYEFKKPATTDFFNVADQNDNWDDADEILKEIEDSVAGKAPSLHTHDDRYYTETEIDTLMNGKASSSHTHSTYAPKASPTFTGTAKGTANTNYSTLQFRNIYATTTDLTAGTTALENGAIAIVYE